MRDNESLQLGTSYRDAITQSQSLSTVCSASPVFRGLKRVGDGMLLQMMTCATEALTLRHGLPTVCSASPDLHGLKRVRDGMTK